RQQWASLLNSAAGRLQSLGIDPMQADIEAHYAWIEGVAARVTTTPDSFAPAPGTTLAYETPRQSNLTQKVDAILIHKVWGLLIFALIMGALFVSIFWLAKPIMDGI